MRITRIYESPRVTKPVHRGPVAGTRCAGQAVDADLQSTDVRLTHGRRADLRVDRRPRRRRMEHRRAGPDQARLRDRTAAAAARALRRRRLPALRPGQVVPGRAAAALGAVGVSGAPTANRAGATRRCSPTSAQPTAHTTRRCRTLHPCADRSGWASTEVHRARLRGHLVLPVARAPPAGQRRPVRLAPRRRTRARAPAARVRAGPASPVGYVLPLRRETAERSASLAGSPAPGSCATSACT